MSRARVEIIRPAGVRIVYTVHAINRSQAALEGIIASAFRAYPDAREAEAVFLEESHEPESRCNESAAGEGRAR